MEQVGPPFTPSRNSRAQSSAIIVVDLDIWQENANGVVTVVMKTKVQQDKASQKGLPCDDRAKQKM